MLILSLFAFYLIGWTIDDMFAEVFEPQDCWQFLFLNHDFLVFRVVHFELIPKEKNSCDQFFKTVDSYETVSCSVDLMILRSVHDISFYLKKVIFNFQYTIIYNCNHNLFSFLIYHTAQEFRI